MIRSTRRHEIAGVLYDTNVLGFKGPRKMTGKVFQTSGINLDP